MCVYNEPTSISYLYGLLNALVDPSFSLISDMTFLVNGVEPINEMMHGLMINEAGQEDFD